MSLLSCYLAISLLAILLCCGPHTTRYICRNNASCYVEHFGRVWDAIQSTGRNMTFGMCVP